tara:strand:+ start:8096 stop:11254 length:3159 start_codon:yes stop_codon:yes gene_type:complete
MALDRQIDFTGGLNTRIPAHKLPENMVQAATNVDFSHGDIRPDRGIGGDGGGQQYYYEKGASWVSTEGIGGQTSFPITVVEEGASTTHTVPTTELGNPLTIKETGTFQVGMTDTVTATHGSNLLTTASGAHGLVVNDTIVLAGTDVPDGLVAGTTYFIKTTPAVNTMTLSATAGGTELALSDNGSGTITLTSVTSTIVNDTALSLGAVSSFAEYNDDLYMGRDGFQITATTITSGSTSVTLSATDVVRVVVSDGITGTGIAKNTTIESINYGTSVVTLNQAATASGSSVLVTINTTPVRLMDGILSKIYPIEIPKVVPLSSSVTQLSFTSSPNDRGGGMHSTKWFSEDFPVPFQYGIAKYDDASGAEAGISDLTPIGFSLANIDGTTNGYNLPLLVKFTIDKADANSELYGKFALYRVGGASTVIKKVNDIYLTSQTDGTPLSVDVGRSSASSPVTTSMVDLQVSGLPTGAEWKAKWYGYKSGSTDRRIYHSGGIASITITNDGANYTAAPTVTIAAPTDSGGKTAEAYAVLTSGKVTNIVITEKGSGYLSAPTVTIAQTPVSSGTDYATGTAVIESGSFQGETTFHTTTSTVRLYGSDADHRIDLHFIVKFTSDDISGVTGKPHSDDTREYIFASTNMEVATVQGDDGIGTHAGCGSVIDFTPPRALIEIEPINNPSSVPANLKFLTEFNNFFMGAVEKRLHISNYAKPNNFAIDGYLDFDAQITGIISRGGEAAVFTEFGLYRVYGNAHNEMRKVQVPTVHGCPVGADKTIAKIRDAVMYVSHAGICYFDGRSVTVLTDELIQDFTRPSATFSENVSGVFEDTYYLLASASNGWKVDMRKNPKISKSTNRASNLHYRGVNNRLYSEAGFIGGADEDNKFSFETRDFTGGNITAEKAYYTVYVTGSDFSGTINIKCDGTLIDTYNYPVVITEFNRALSISTAKVANRASVEFVDCTGKIASVSIKYDNLAEQQKRRFNSVTLTYTGTPTVVIKVDSVTKIESTTLTDPGTGNTGTSTLYFPSMTEGYLPHITTDETETSRISGSVFDSEAI